MKQAMCYMRVSTREQGRSGLGLEAQRHDIERFGLREGFAVTHHRRTSAMVRFQSSRHG